MLEELYIGGKQVDVKDTSIVRSYKTPYFSDVESLFSDSTYTIKLPPTERNKAVMQYLHEADMNTDFPYTYHYSDYIVEGMQIIRNGEVKVLGDFEIQIVYGVNREKYLPLKDRKLNEIVPKGTTILESDWIVDWRKGNVIYNTGKKFVFLDYISGERVSDVLTINSIVQPKTMPDEPYLSNMKHMTMHPFVPFNNILDLISADLAIETFDDLKNRVTIHKGIIIGSKKANKTYTFAPPEIPYYINGGSSFYLKMPTYGTDSKNILITSQDNVREFHINSFSTGLENLKINYSCSAEITGVIIKIELEERGIGFETTLTNIPFTVTRPSTNYIYTFDLEIINDSAKNGHYFLIKMTTQSSEASYSIYSQLNKFTYKLTECVYGIAPYLEENSYGGYFDVLLNLPNMNAIDFISQMLIITGLFISYNKEGDFKFNSLDEFKTNYNNGNIYDWSGKISNVRNSKYQFNSNAQKNWIKFNNSDNTNYVSKDFIEVQDETITTEKDLYKIDFDLADKSASGISEYLLYKQKVSESRDSANNVTKIFSNEYNSKESVEVMDIDGIAYNEPCLPNFIAGTTFKMQANGLGNNDLNSDGAYALSLSDIVYGVGNNTGDIISGTVVSIDYTTGDFGISDGVLLNETYTLTITKQSGGFITKNYLTYQKIINRPIVKEVDVLLDFYESANIDFTKPIYIKEWGKYCMLLELTAPNKGLCEAKLLLINQTL